MNLFATSPDWVLWLLVVLLGAAVIQDAMQLRISNLISAPVALLAIIAMSTSGLEVSLWQNFLVFAALLLIGMLLFARRILGGGDVKLFAAVGLWVDCFGALRLIIAVCLAGGLLAVLILLVRTFVPDAVSARIETLRPRAGIPYGVAIAAGTLIIAATSTI